ncbi:calcium-binding protein [Aestuariivirga sp.]|uniref:calcium-binding protein n=1 Tax=Aestuariivirga sp. TaxID=2650926 RepID=UPI0039E247CC
MPVIGGYSTTMYYLNANEQALLLPTAILSVDNNPGIQNAQNDSDQYQTGCVARIQGSLVSLNANALTFYAGPGNVGNFVVTVGQNGLIDASVNHAAVVVQGSGNVINNAGEINGGVGLWCEAWSGGDVFNSGSITGSRFSGIKVLNSTAADITNTGSIAGRGGIELANSTAHIVNSGHITSKDAALAAIDGGAASAAFDVRNTGTLTAVKDAIEGSGFDDTVFNFGTIDGNVTLGGGNDTYRGAHGTALAAIDGGIGNDLLIGGLGDDTLLGGAGNDRLNGGVGDDTLTGSQGVDQFIFQSGGGNDTVTDFTNGPDNINLKAFHLANFASLNGHAHNVAGGMALDLTSFGGGVIMFNGFSVAQFDVTDVIL